MKNKKKVLVIVGPTAVGKTALSVDLAKKFNGEIISGDSLQVYRGLNIGTAKATIEERQGIPHYLLDERDLTEGFSASDFKELAEGYIEEITSRGKLPIIVGGTGLYIQSLLFDFNLGGKEKEVDKERLVKERQELTAYFETHGSVKLWEKLKRLDPIGADSIHPNNIKRVIRGIEVFRETGKSIAEQTQEANLDLSQAVYDAKVIGLETERTLLYQRINQRVEGMISEGLLEEAKNVYQVRPAQSEQGIGYKELFPYFDGSISLEEAIIQVQQNSRRYAKRQLTWFRNRMTVSWWDILRFPESKKDLEKAVIKWLEGKEIEKELD